MLEILNFAFQSFWHFLGCVIILGVIVNAPTALVRAIFEGINTRKHGWNTESTSKIKNLTEQLQNLND
jgi:hypothetical protein